MGRKSRTKKLPSSKVSDVWALDEAIQARNDAATFDGEEGEHRRSEGMDVAAVLGSMCCALPAAPAL